MELAGLVVGGIPIALWALEKYAEPYETFHRYRRAIENLRTDLNLQKHILGTTVSNLGLPSNPTRQELRECLETKFPSRADDLMSIIERMEEAVAVLLKMLEVDVTTKPGQLSGKAQWQWKRVKYSFTTKKWKGVIADLTKWNTDLAKALESPEVPEQDDTRIVEDLKRRFNLKRSDAIRQCLASFHRALECGFRCGCKTPHRAAIDLDWASYESDSAKNLRVAVSYEAPTHGKAGSWLKLGITSETGEVPEPTPESVAPPSPSPVKRAQPLVSLQSAESGLPTRNSSFRSKVQFKLTRAHTETPRRPASPIDTVPPSETDVLYGVPPAQAPTNPRMTSLCDALCTEAGTWPLKRFLRDPDDDKVRHYSLHNSIDSPHIIKAVPLKSLLSPRSHQMRNPYLALTTKQRFGIAATIAWSVLHLAHSPWLDERKWDQEQVAMFIERTRNGREMYSCHPCASYVFSPPVCQEEEEPLDNLVSNLIPNRIVFALGILLIELCVSEPVSKIRGDVGEADSLLEDYHAAMCRLDEVYRLAGNSYGYATERCIKCSFQAQGMHKDFEFSMFRRQFYEVVVAPVQATYLAFPDAYSVV